MNRKIVTVIVIAIVSGVSFAQIKSDDLRVRVELDKAIEQMQSQSDGQPVPEELKKQAQQEISDSLSKIDKLKEEAFKKGLNKKPEVQAAFKNVEAQFYAQVLYDDYQKNLKMTDSDIKETYRLMNQKFKISQIDFASEEDAQKGIIALKKGKSFEVLAKETLGEQYIPYDQLPELTMAQLDPEALPFLSGSTKGAITPEPVRSKEAYSLMKIEDIQNGAILTDKELAEQKEALTRQTIAFKAQQYMSKLMNAR